MNLKKYKYVILYKEKESENDFSYVQNKLDNGIVLTTPFSSKAKIFSSKEDSIKQMEEWNEQNSCIVKRIEI